MIATAATSVINPPMIAIAQTANDAETVSERATAIAAKAIAQADARIETSIDTMHADA